MSVQPYPRSVSIYKGEGRFLLVPDVKHIGGYRISVDDITIIDEIEKESKKLGYATLSSMKYIENTPLYVGLPEDFWKKGLYNGCIKSIKLSANATAEEYYEQNPMNFKYQR